MIAWDVFVRDGLARAERELAEVEGLASFYGRRADQLRGEIQSAREIVRKTQSCATPDAPATADAGRAG